MPRDRKIFGHVHPYFQIRFFKILLAMTSSTFLNGWSSIYFIFTLSMKSRVQESVELRGSNVYRHLKIVHFQLKYLLLVFLYIMFKFYSLFSVLSCLLDKQRFYITLQIRIIKYIFCYIISSRLLCMTTKSQTFGNY